MRPNLGRWSPRSRSPGPRCDQDGCTREGRVCTLYKGSTVILRGTYCQACRHALTLVLAPGIPIDPDYRWG